MKFSLLLFLFKTLTVGQYSVNAGDEILGVWITEGEKAQIEIYKKDGLYHGKIISLKEPYNSKGEPKKDINNKDKSLRDRPIVGINLVSGFVFDGDDRWEDGEVYDPENGKTYACYMKLRRGKLQVRGYIGVSLFGRTVVWTRTK